MKQSGINSDSLVALYQSQVVPAVTCSAPVWFPMIKHYQQKDVEKIQKLALRIIFPECEHYCDQLAAAKLNTLCERLENTTHAAHM